MVAPVLTHPGEDAALGELLQPAPLADGLYWPGFSEIDANRDMGDSAITETVGWGGCVIAGAPGILALTGGTPEDALDWTRQNMSISLARSSTYRLPALGFEGAPIGIDIRKVVATGTTPVIDSAIAHRQPGIGMIGSGIVHYTRPSSASRRRSRRLNSGTARLCKQKWCRDTCGWTRPQSRDARAEPRHGEGS